ncbi:MAG: hypothetical protein LBH46_01275 [Rickettsiales bacterium]|jgi:serine/threonine protein kinase|nr:hypothetical protein [Rickettsiales bacterium]
MLLLETLGKTGENGEIQLPKGFVKIRELLRNFSRGPENNDTDTSLMKRASGSADKLKIGRPSASFLTAIFPLFESIEILHSSGLAHLDLKPDNILYTDINTVGTKRKRDGLQEIAPGTRIGKFLIGDYGSIAKVSTTESSASTPAYLSPEIAKNGTGEKKGQDVYALRLTIAEIILGNGYFSGKISGKCADLKLVGFNLCHELVTKHPDEYRKIIQKGLVEIERKTENTPCEGIHKLLKGMLEFDPRNRLTISAAKEKLKKMITRERLEVPTAKPKPVSKLGRDIYPVVQRYKKTKEQDEMLREAAEFASEKVANYNEAVEEREIERVATQALKDAAALESREANVEELKIVATQAVEDVGELTEGIFCNNFDYLVKKETPTYKQILEALILSNREDGKVSQLSVSQLSSFLGGDTAMVISSDYGCEHEGEGLIVKFITDKGEPIVFGDNGGYFFEISLPEIAKELNKFDEGRTQRHGEITLGQRQAQEARSVRTAAIEPETPAEPKIPTGGDWRSEANRGEQNDPRRQNPQTGERGGRGRDSENSRG